MNYSIGEMAKMSGVSIRTLHYYDEIGLLKPAKISDTGYRFYNNDSIEKLQQILLFKELQFPLEEIKEIIDNPDYDKTRALAMHKELLTLKRNRLTGLIKLTDKLIEGGCISMKEFEHSAFDKAKDKYQKEVKQRWGDTKAYKVSEKKYASYNKDDLARIEAQGNEIFKGFAELRGNNSNDESVFALVKRWQEHISKNFYPCSDEILASLGEMYITDERFKANIDAFGEGTAELMSKAIKEYCSKK